MDYQALPLTGTKAQGKSAVLARSWEGDRNLCFHAEAFPTGAKCLGLVVKDQRGQRNQGQEPAHSGRRCVYDFLLQPHILDHAVHRQRVRAALGISCVPGLASIVPQHLWESRLVTSVLGQRLGRRALWPGQPDITQKGSGMRGGFCHGT